MNNRLLSWPGAKFRQLNEILKYIDISDKKIICEPYFGTGAFSLNFPDKNYFVGAEKNIHLFNLLDKLFNNTEDLINKISYYRELYSGAKTEREIFIEMRNTFNDMALNDIKNIDAAALLWVLIYQSTNNLARFTKRGTYTQTWGKGRNVPDPHIFFNDYKIEIIKTIRDKIKIHHLDEELFDDLYTNIKQLNDVVVYLDPPYILRNEVYDRDWKLQAEQNLIHHLKKMDDLNISWFMTNYLNVEKNGQIINHPMLNDFNNDNWSIYPLNRKIDSRPTAIGNNAFECIIIGENKDIKKG